MQMQGFRANPGSGVPEAVVSLLTAENLDCRLARAAFVIYMKWRTGVGRQPLRPEVEELQKFSSNQPLSALVGRLEEMLFRYWFVQSLFADLARREPVRAEMEQLLLAWDESGKTISRLIREMAENPVADVGEAADQVQ